MFITTDHYQSDRRRMKAFVAMRIPEEGCRLVVADGPDEGEVWVDLDPVRYDDGEMDLHLETNCREAVYLPDIYMRFRRQEMTSWEWCSEVEGEITRWKFRFLEGELAVLRWADPSEGVPDWGQAPFSQALARVQGQLAEIIAKLDGLDGLRERMSFQDDDPSFTVHQVAQKLQVSPSKVYQLTESGKLKSYKTGNQVRIKASHIREFQTRHTRTVVETKRRRSGSFNKSEAARLFGPGWDS
jgi:excisionase family DNA binding protein